MVVKQKYITKKKRGEQNKIHATHVKRDKMKSAQKKTFINMENYVEATCILHIVNNWNVDQN